MKKQNIIIGNEYFTVDQGGRPQIDKVKVLSFNETQVNQIVKVKSIAHHGSYSVYIANLFETNDDAFIELRRLDDIEQNEYAKSIETIEDLIEFSMFHDPNENYNAREVIYSKMKEFGLNTDRFKDS